MNEQNFSSEPGKTEPSSPISDSFKKYPVRQAFQQFGQQAMAGLTPHQVSVMNLISQCKTGDLGYNIAYCPECDKYLVHACSCNNRECPNCQSNLEEAWIEERSHEALPGVSYFHIVFTLPNPVVKLFQFNKEKMYPLLASASSRTVVEQAQGIPHNGFTPAVITVTHPGGSKMNFRPHIHMIVSGGGLNKLGQFRMARRKGFFLSLNQMAAGFRGRFLSGLKDLYAKNELFLPEKLVDPGDPFGFQNFINSLFRVKWLPFIKETFVGKKDTQQGKSKGNAIRYLARYIFRTGISNRRILHVSDKDVTYEYKDYNDGGTIKPTSLPGDVFVRTFLELVMPARCPKVRYFGMMANSVKNRRLKLAFQLLSAEYSPVKLRGKGSSARDLILMLHGVDIDICPYCKQAHLVRSRMLISPNSHIPDQLRKAISEPLSDLVPVP